ncbi:MAG: glycosyltransferase family 2 protein [Candidatus Thermoplasmatota archaeon]|nr:glycosyltransferase family 2 protein [Candidatus Thermoplasmatota archaeon]
MSNRPNLMADEPSSQIKESQKDSSERPFISVVVDGFKRKEFIIDAVKSVRKQDINENAYELIVLRAFDDIVLDKQLAQNRAKVYDVKDMSLGEAIAFSAEKSQGEVICFLDDDDMFMPSKLSKIESIFKSDPTIGYCHNSQVFCDENANPISSSNVAERKTLDISFSNRQLSLSLKQLRVKKINPGTLYFNLSSISVRKRLLTGKLNVIKKITGHIDDLIFFLALSAKEEVRLINISDTLTIYMVHNSMTNIVHRASNFSIREFRIKQLSDYVHSSRVNSEVSRNSEAHLLAISILTYDRASLYNVKKEPKELIIETVNLIRKSYLKNIEYNLKKRLTTYISFLSFAMFYVLAKHFPFLWKLSLVFPKVESFRQ